MIGKKKLGTIKEEIREAFARKGIDVETWLDQEMSKLRDQPKKDRKRAETLKQIRKGLTKVGPAKKKKPKLGATRSTVNK